MKLDEYLKEVGISISEFSRRIDVSNATLYNILAGRGDIRLSTAIKIEETTKGQVKIKELLSKEFLENLHKDLLAHKSSHKKYQRNKEKN